MITFTSVELFEKIEMLAHVGCYEVDLNKGICFFSENLVRIFNFPVKEFYNIEEFYSLIYKEDLEDVFSGYKQCIKKQEDFNYHFRCNNPKGGFLYVNNRSKIYYDRDGFAYKITGMIQDITEQAETEKKIQELNNLNSQKNEVLAIVSHDLRAPIANIRGLITILRMVPDSERHKLYNMLEATCEHANNIISELIETAELEEQSYKPQFEKCNINDLVRKSVNGFRLKAWEKNIHLKTYFCNDALADVDPVKFSRVIDNLISNAIKFTSQKSNVEIFTEKRNGLILLKIRDYGIGIEKENIDQLFEKFTKAKKSGTIGEKTIGLGLSIVKKIVNLHKGKISVDSSVGKGTTFTIEINEG
jgi:two-component system sensor histidine kinase VicK